MKKVYYIFIVMITTLMLFQGCVYNNKKNTNQNTFKEKNIDKNQQNKSINYLTGLLIPKSDAKRRPVGIMINNHSKAIPQSGISQADIIYETLAEGGITRLFAIFQKFDSKKIGPVRSARHYFLEYAFDHDAIYVHYGRSPQAEEAIKNFKVNNLEGLSYLDSIMCFRDNKRKAPHNAYTSYEGIIKAWDKIGYRKELKSSFEPKFKFNDKEKDLTTNNQALQITLPFSHNKLYTSKFVYNKDNKLYERFHMKNKPHIDKENNKQLKYKNIIVQITDIWQIKNDKYGRINQNLISSGKGYYLTNGKIIPIIWGKKSHELPTKYYDETKKEIKLNKGKTWIAIFPSNKQVIINEDSTDINKS